MSVMAAAAMESMKAFCARVGDTLPRLFGALLIVVLGWIVAGWLQRLFVQALKALKLDELAQSIRVNEILHRGEIRYSLSELLGVFLYWLVLLATLLAALNALGLTIAAELLERVLSYMPNVVAGVIVLVLGLFFATLLGGLVQTAAANAGIGQARGLGQIARVAVIVFTAAIAMEKFFSSMIIQATFSIVVAAVAFGTALAFGLGCKDIAGKFVGDVIDQFKKRR